MIRRIKWMMITRIKWLMIMRIKRMMIHTGDLGLNLRACAIPKDFWWGKSLGVQRLSLKV
jgi:hypothetical protein